MVTTSKFVQLNDHILLEYIYNSKIINTADSSFLRIINVYNSSLNYLSYNPSNFIKPKQLTNNILDNTVQPIDDNRWAHFDTDRPIKFFEQNNKMLRFEGVWEDLQSNIDVLYDTIKIHIVSGWNFTDTAGFVIRAAYVDKTLNNVIYVANHAYLKEDTNINFNPRPIFLGNRTYDKYIEFSIPSLNNLSNINTELGNIFLTTNQNILTQTFDYQNAKLNILFYDVGNYVLENGQTILKTTMPIDNDTVGLIRIDIDPFDPMSQLYAVVQESVTGDYFELFPSYEGSFIEDFIYSQMAKFNYSYTLIHDIEVYEQISNFGDYTEIMSQKFTYFQDSGFDKPFKFRPIIENNNAITFTIDYTIRLYNKTNESQVIRKASLTYPNANKYGRSMTHIGIDSSYQPMRIVNKIVNNDNVSEFSNLYSKKNYINNVLTSQGSSILQYAVINTKNICVNNYTLFVDNITTTTNILFDGTKQYVDNIKFKQIVDSDIIYGQGDAIIYLTEFDNFIKFKIYKVDGISNIAIPYSDIVNSPNTIFYLIFFDSTGKKIRITQYSDKANIADLQSGEILFKIPALNAVDIIKSIDKRFYITFENRIPQQVTGSSSLNVKSDFEVVLYQGKADVASNYKIDNNNDFNTKQNSLIVLAQQLQTAIDLQRNL